MALRLLISKLNGENLGHFGEEYLEVLKTMQEES